MKKNLIEVLAVTGMLFVISCGNDNDFGVTIYPFRKEF